MIVAHLSQFFPGVSPSFDLLILVHNAGSIGDVSRRIEEMNDSKNWHQYLQANFVSMVLLNNLVLKMVTEQVSFAQLA